MMVVKMSHDFPTDTLSTNFGLKPRGPAVTERCSMPNGSGLLDNCLDAITRNWPARADTRLTAIALEVPMKWAFPPLD
jgi:hypothetical protein